MYRITFVLDSFQGKHDREQSHRQLYILLQALTSVDEEYLCRHPEAPMLYESGVRYMEEPPGQEDWQDIPTCLKMRAGDCLPVETMVLKQDYTFAELGSLQVGDIIRGQDEWTQVEAVAFTGEKPILSFELDNGSFLRASPEHRVFLSNGEEVRAEDVKVGQRLLSPKQPFPASPAPHHDDRFSPADFAWLLGTYIADGWYDLNGSRFCISGDDVNPKRRKLEQKDRVIALMQAAGISTRRHRKYVDVHDRRLTEYFMQAGGRAPSKKVPDLHMFSSEQISSLVAGLETDASTAESGSLTIGTTSPVLAAQLRVLFRMLDQSVHIRRWDEHGGLGSHPIYRVGIRRAPDSSMSSTWQKRSETSRRSAGVRSIREEPPTACADITTSSGRFYLPESDVVVHNCEDLACWRAAELRVRHGIKAQPTFTWKQRPNGGYLYHIQVQLPDGRKEDPSRVLGMR